MQGSNHPVSSAGLHWAAWPFLKENHFCIMKSELCLITGKVTMNFERRKLSECTKKPRNEPVLIFGCPHFSRRHEFVGCVSSQVGVSTGSSHKDYREFSFCGWTQRHKKTNNDSEEYSGFQLLTSTELIKQQEDSCFHRTTEIWDLMLDPTYLNYNLSLTV